MPTIAAVANVYNEANALPGWLENVTSWADWVGVMHSGPSGEMSDDGTLDVLSKWHVPTQFCSIDNGFGEVRSKTLRMCPPGIDWIMLLDADERFYPLVRVMTCAGESTPPELVDAALYDYGNPNFEKDGSKLKQVIQSYDASIDFEACPSNFENLKLLGANLTVTAGELYDQLAWLKQVMGDNDKLDAIKVIRRHWHDFSFKRPTQNWHTQPDYQMRLLRNRESIHFADDTRMHERVVGVNCVHEPNHTKGPFYDHFHCHFKMQEPEQRRYDVAVYGAIDRGEKPPSWQEWRTRV